jgi:hypothetical protein
MSQSMRTAAAATRHASRLFSASSPLTRSVPPPLLSPFSDYPFYTSKHQPAFAILGDGERKERKKKKRTEKKKIEWTMRFVFINSFYFVLFFWRRRIYFHPKEYYYYWGN